MAERLTSLQASTPRMLDAVGALVAEESPSDVPDALDGCATAVEELGRDLLGVGARRLATPDGRPCLHWAFGTPRVLVLGHLDTVWPLGTLARWPFAHDGERATGPGVLDMKAGLVQALFALASLDDLDGVGVLVTSDEELGSPGSRGVVEDVARGCEAVLVAEPAAGYALKTARKGASFYRLEIEGRAAHAGLAPEEGVNALIELAHQVRVIDRLGRPQVGTTVTPTVAQAGTTRNTVPAHAAAEIDVRAATLEEQRRIDAEMRALRPHLRGASLRVDGGANRPPLERAMSEGLLARAQRVAAVVGLPPLTGVAVGGGSDGNFTAGIGIPTLDGLGAVGGHAHAEGEFVEIGSIAPRAALLAGLVADLLG